MPRILNLGIRWSLMVSFTLQPLCPQLCKPRHVLDKSLSGPRRESGIIGEEKIFPQLGLEPPSPYYPAGSLSMQLPLLS
jgi:hypothetical protein